MFAVFVRFKSSNGWSGEYTYKSEVELDRGTLVVVPSLTGFYQVGKVASCTPWDQFASNPNITYKTINLVVTELGESNG